MTIWRQHGIHVQTALFQTGMKWIPPSTRSFHFSLVDRATAFMQAILSDYAVCVSRVLIVT